MACPYEQFFKEADSDGNGYLSMDELGAVFKDHGYNFSSEQLKDMFGQADADTDQKVTFDEFMAVMGGKPEGQHKAAGMRKVFKAFDTDGSGTIEKEELHEALKEIGSTASEEDIKRIMEFADQDASGSLNYEEFIALFE